jgi:methylmalonyl-CoA mutase N-terminal domain/subunit
MAVAVANAIETLEEMLRRGHDVDWVAERLAFFWSPASDFFEEISRIRAVRRLWYKIMKYKFDAKSARSVWMRCHVQTSGITLFREEPLNNIVRAAYEALAAVLGGAQSLHVDSYDEAYSVPTEEAALVSLRTQQILQNETGVTEVVDPLGGSFYVEALTNDIEKRILDEITEIEEQGGYVAAIEKGWLHRKIASYAYREQRMIESSDIKVLGHSWQKSTTPLPEIDVFRYPEGVEEKQIERVKKLRAEREPQKVESALNALRDACKRGVNVVPYSVDCARANCTEGELFKVFKDAFGLWKAPSFW